MNYKRKNELAQKANKTNIINNDLMPNIREVIKDNMLQIRENQINTLCDKMDNFEENQYKIDDELNKLKSHNDMLSEGIPEIDK